jgi:protocatechuate 3,4-dioxygenase, beta subunit
MEQSKITRRNVIHAGIVAGTSLGVISQSQGLSPNTITPPHTEGPFYPIAPQDDKDADLTRVGENSTTAKGEVIIVEGQVLGHDGAPIANAVVDIWQANAGGRYAHEKDPNPAQLDPNFQGWAIMTTDEEGRYRIKTVKPGAYKVDANWTRPPHIHFKVSRRGFQEITTQMYFDKEPLNALDHLLNKLDAKLQPALIAKRKEPGAAFRFDITLATV